MIKVFIVDDSVVARSMLSRIISEDPAMEIVGEASTGQGGIIMLEETNPDVILLEADIGGGMKIQDVIIEIKKISPQTKMILCADPLTTKLVIPAAEVGADDFVEKPYKKTKVLRVIREVCGKKC